MKKLKNITETWKTFNQNILLLTDKDINTRSTSYVSRILRVQFGIMVADTLGVLATVPVLSNFLYHDFQLPHLYFFT